MSKSNDNVSWSRVRRAGFFAVVFSFGSILADVSAQRPDKNSNCLNEKAARSEEDKIHPKVGSFQTQPLRAGSFGNR